MSDTDDHVCFGCATPIDDYQPHIHVLLDEWGTGQGRPALGLGDVLTVPFCEPCTVTDGRSGWELEQHEIAADAQETR